MKIYQQAENIKLVHSGNNYFHLLEEIIDSTKETLHLQTYIFDTDETGSRIVNALVRASKRKVVIHLLLDAFGSASFSKHSITLLREAGVHVRFFAPFFSSENIHWGRRLHYKIIVSDKRIALTGGINIANKYNESEQAEPWLDYAILTEGAVCEYLHILCEQVYYKKSNLSLRVWEKNLKPESAKSFRVRYRLNDRLRRANEIHSSYSYHILNANQCITIIGSYFLPGRTFRNMLALASSRGVKINLILASQSDIKTLRMAESYLYAYYIRNKINVFEWQKSVLHGKAIIVDNEWVSIGSFNINFLSHYLSVELNTEVDDKQFAQGFAEHIDHIIDTGCKQIDLKKYAHSPNTINQFIMWLAYNLFRLIKNISVRRKPHLR